MLVGPVPPAGDARIRGCCGPHCRVRARDPRPNILVIQLDDTRADGIDRMPTLLAQRRARKASPSPTRSSSTRSARPAAPRCSPACTARHHGVRGRSAARSAAPTFPRAGCRPPDRRGMAAAAGYMTGLFGKYVNGYGFGATERSAGAGWDLLRPAGLDAVARDDLAEHFGGIRGTTYTLVDEHGIPTVTTTTRPISSTAPTCSARKLRSLHRRCGRPGAALLRCLDAVRIACDVPSRCRPEPAAATCASSAGCRLAAGELERGGHVRQAPRHARCSRAVSVGSQVDLYNDNSADGRTSRCWQSTSNCA